MSKQKIQQKNFTRKEPIGPQVIETQNSRPKNFLLRSVPVYIFLLFLIIPACSLGYFFHLRTAKQHAVQNDQDSHNAESRTKLVRGKDQLLVHPLLFVDIENEHYFGSLKNKLDQYLLQSSTQGNLMSASVYLKDLNTGNFFSINEDSLYDPASLMKVPLLMCYLLEAEQNPAVLQKKYLYPEASANSTVKLITDKTLVAGQQYTVEQLLYYMIVHSDNEAFWLLNKNMDHRQLDALDTRLAIPKNYDVVHYPASDQHAIAGVNAVAHYFNVLYNATYLDKKMSAYALNLLTKSTYDDGLTKEMEPNLTVAHKFGERTLSYVVNNNLENLYSEFHEFGIIYLEERPYLLGVMTRGHESGKLQTIVSTIARIVFDEVKMLN